jgi:transposase
LHRDFCEIAICEDGVVRSAGRVSMTPEALEAFAASLESTDRVALEVSGGAWEVARLLEPHVQKVIVVSPDDTGIAQTRTKTDRLDARALAKLLWQGELDAVWMPDERCRVLRRRLARREQLVRSRSRTKNEVHAVLMRRLQASRRALICSGSRAASGFAPGSCRSRRPRPCSRRCGTSRSWTARSQTSSG